MGLNEASPRLSHRLIWGVSGIWFGVLSAVMLFYWGHTGDQRLGVGQSVVEDRKGDKQFGMH